MGKKLLCLLGLVVLVFAAGAQLVPTEMAIGGINDDEGYAIAQTPDKGYILAGSVTSYGAGVSNVYVIRLDSSANLLWTKTVGGTSADAGFSMVQTKDKGIAIAGSTSSFGAGDYDIYVVKLDSAGNLQWSRSVGGTDAEYGYGIVQTSDKGYAVAGYTSSFGDSVYGDAYIVKLDSAGNLLWTKAIGGKNETEAYSIVETPDKGLAISGYTYSYGDTIHGDAYIIKLSASGNLLWTRTVGGSFFDVGYAINNTSDKGLIVVGSTTSYGAGNADDYVIKLDSAGNLKWTKTIGGSGAEEAWGVTEANDKGLVITGFSETYKTGGNSSVYTVKLDSVGNLLWTRAIGGVSGFDQGNGIVRTTDKGYAIGGSTESYGLGLSNVFFIKLDSVGNSCNLAFIDSGKVSSGGIVSSGAVVNSGGVLSSGGTVGSGGMVTNICPVEKVSSVQKNEMNTVIYPNPSGGVFTLTITNYNVGTRDYIEIYDVLGKQVYSAEIINPQMQISINNGSQGLFLYRIVNAAGQQLAAGKIMVQK